MKPETTTAINGACAPVEAQTTVRSRRASFETAMMCLVVSMIAGVGLIFSGVTIIDHIGKAFLLIGASSLMLTLIIMMVRPIPAAIKVVYTVLLAAVSLAGALNFIFPDESSRIEYDGYYMDKHSVMSTTRHGQRISYYIVYEADNGRTYTKSVSENEYYYEQYPQTIKMKEERGLFGWEIDITEGPDFNGRLVWLLLALDLCCCEALWLFTRWNMDFRRTYAWIAIAAMAGTMVLMFLAPPIHLFLAFAVVATAVGIALSFLLMTNYYRAEKGPAEVACIVSEQQHVNRTTKRVTYTYGFALADGFEFKWGGEHNTLVGEIKEQGLSVRVDRGCFGMRVIKAI